MEQKNIDVMMLISNIQKYFGHIKTNTVVIKGVNDNELFDIIDLMKDYNSEIRFIEYMDVGESNKWHLNKVVPSKDLRERICQRYHLTQLDTDITSTATKWKINNSKATLGFISSISEPFCSNCTRARLSVDGKIFTCLFASEGFDIKSIIRSDDYERKFLEYFNEIWSQRSDQYSELRFTKKKIFLRWKCLILVANHEISFIFILSSRYNCRTIGRLSNFKPNVS